MTKRNIAIALTALVISTSALVFALTDSASATKGDSWHGTTRPRLATETGTKSATVSRTSSTKSTTGTPAPASATGQSDCNVTSSHIYPAGKRAVFTVEGECEITLASYAIHGPALDDQTLYDSTTEEFSCANPLSAGGDGTTIATGHGVAVGVTSLGGTCTHELTVAVPDCQFQVDLAQGKPLEPPNYNTALLAYRFGGEGECLTPSTTTTSSTTSTTTAPSTTTSTTEPTSPSTSVLTSATVVLPTVPTTSEVIGTRSTPTELPESGSNELVLKTLAGLGLIGLGQLSLRRGHRGG